MRIRSQTSFVAGMMLLLGVLMCAMPLGMMRAFAADGPVPAGVFVLAALFGVPGVLCVFLSAKALVTRARLGSWELECPAGGIALGGPGLVQLMPPRVVTLTGDVECTLTCIRSMPRRNVRSTGGGVHESSGAASGRLFDTSWTVPASRIDPGTGLPITLPMPQSGLASRRGRDGNVEWKLSVTVRVDGTEHALEFEIPVRA
ncbi:MAG: hypothetical protein ABW221_16670 [Vicinamibacteria bacterium]